MSNPRTGRTEARIISASRTTRRLVVAIACLLTGATASAGNFSAALESIRDDDLKKHVTVLASDTFEGREAGSRGGKAAGVYLVKQLQKFRVAPAGPGNRYFQGFGNDFRNILAVVPGGDAQLKHEFIIVGAHYDHVGFGTRRNSYGPVGYIHNGADDNASGTAGVLELAQAFASLRPRLKRSLLFVFWDAEEKGLLGSQHWLGRPTIPLKQVRLLINLDMIGRLRKKTLTVYGVRTAHGLRRLVSEQNRAKDLQIDFRWDIIRDSDHYPFVTNGIPYLMPYTRRHADYHRPTDDVDKLNLKGMQQITRLLFGVIRRAANQPRLPAFRAASREEDESVRKWFLTPAEPLPPRFGVSWDAKRAEKQDVSLTHVVSGSPAERAGLRIGDRIVEFGGYRIDAADDFFSLVQAARNPVPTLIKRRGIEKPFKLTVELNGVPVQLGIAWRVDDAAPNSMLLVRVDPGSPADRAGLKVTDRIYAVAGQRFASSDEFQKLIHARQNPLELTIERHGQVRPVTLKWLPERPRAAKPNADQPVEPSPTNK